MLKAGVHNTPNRFAWSERQRTLNGACVRCLALRAVRQACVLAYKTAQELTGGRLPKLFGTKCARLTVQAPECADVWKATWPHSQRT